MSNRKPTLEYLTPGVESGQDATRFERADKALTASALAIVVLVLVMWTILALAVH